MKILQVIPYFCFGGAETMCENLCYALKKQGHDVVAVSLGSERTPIALRMEKSGVRIVYLDKKPGLDLRMFPRLISLFRREKPEVVHTHLSVIKYVGLAAKLAGVKKCVHTVHNVAYEEAEGILQKISNRFYFHAGWSVPVALSPEVQKTIVEFYNLPEEKVPVIYNGIDLSRCIPKESYGAENLTLTHIGRFNPQKNHRGLLEAFQKILQQVPGCRLQLLGEGELREEMERYARELDVAENVEFAGSQSNVYPYLNRADIFLLPSLYEGMPMTIIEAMGTGLPVVASAVGGVPDMLRQGESGLLVSTDPQEVCDACVTLAKDEALRRKLGETARRESVRFSAEYMARRYLEEYRK